MSGSTFVLIDHDRGAIGEDTGQALAFAARRGPTRPSPRS